MISGVRASSIRIEFDLVDDRERMAALDHLGRLVAEIVAQIVEAEFVVGAVGDIGGVGALAFALAEAIDDHAHRQAEKGIDPAHPLGVAGGQIVVDGDEVDALAGQGIQIERQGGDQGLALAGAHFGDAAPVQHHAPNHLHVVVPLPQGPLGRLAHHGEGLVQQLIERLARGDPALEFVGLGLEIGVRERGDRGLEGVDPGHLAHHRLDLAVVGGAEQGLEQGHAAGIPVQYRQEKAAPPSAASLGASPIGSWRSDSRPARLPASVEAHPSRRGSAAADLCSALESVNAKPEPAGLLRRPFRMRRRQ